LVSTDFSLIDRIRWNGEISLESFTEPGNWIRSSIVRYGGLLPFHAAKTAGDIQPPKIETDVRPMTIAEKIITRHGEDCRAVAPADVDFAATDLRFSHEYVTPMAAAVLEREIGPDARIDHPASVLFFQDHLVHVRDVVGTQPSQLRVADMATQLCLRQQ